MSAARRASYSPGTWTAAAGPAAWLIADLPLDGDMTRRCWELLCGGADGLAVLGVLAAGGFSELPPFALAGVVDGATVVWICGGAEVTVDGQVLGSGGALTWAEHRVGAAAEVVLHAGGTPAGLSALPLAVGVVGASALTLAGDVVARPEPLPAAEPADWAVDLPVAAPAAPLPPPPAPPPHLTIVLTDDFAPEEPAPASDLTLPSLGDEPEPELEVEPDEEDLPPVEPTTPSPEADAPGGAGAYDALFGATIDRSVEEAAVREAEVDVAPSSPTVPEPVPEPAVAPPVVAPPPVPPPPVSTGLIDFVPGAGGFPPAAPPPVAPAPVPPPVEPTGLVDRVSPSGFGGPGLTIDRRTQEAMAAMAAADPAVVGPTVQAVRCPSGHLNAVHAARCRACQQPVAEQAPETVPRPTLGVLRLSTGDVIVLDRPVVMGRGPRQDRLVGDEHPNVVRIPSPEEDISRSHVEIRLDGWHVSAVDLGSTNGTVVALPGSQPERLRPHHPAAIEPGTVVTLAERFSFGFEVTP